MNAGRRIRVQRSREFERNLKLFSKTTEIRQWIQHPMSFLVRILKHSSQSIVAGVTGAVGSFVAAAVIARTLGVEATATVGMALWIVFLMTTLSDVGITGALSRFLSAHRGEGEPGEFQTLTSYAFKVFFLAIIAGLVLTAAALRLYWPDILSKYAATPREGYIFCGFVLLCFVVHMLYAFSYQLLRGQRAFGTITLLSFVGTVLQILLVFVGSRWLGANGAILAYVGFSVPLLWALTKLRPAPRLPEIEERRRMRSYAATFYASALFSPLLWVRVDVIFVDQLRAAYEVGLFVAAATIAALLLQLCQMVCNALLPNIVNAAHEGEGALRRASATAARFGLLLLLPATTMGAAVAPRVIDAIYGSAFAGAGTAAALLCLAAGASAITLVVSSVLNATDSNASLARNGMIGAALTVALGIALVSQFGLIGAAVARLCAQSAVALFNLLALRRRMPGVVRTRWLAPMLFASLCAGAAALAVSSSTTGFLIVLPALAFGGAIYLALSLLFLNPTPHELDRASGLASGQPRTVAKMLVFMVRIAGWRGNKRQVATDRGPSPK